MPIDAIQEFSSQQNPKAENGFRQGGVVNVGIKSGTNSLHGTAYAFGRDASATDAGQLLHQGHCSTPGVPPPPGNPCNLEQFGATAGGPILKDKLFWFASFEGLRWTWATWPRSQSHRAVAMTAARPDQPIEFGRRVQGT